MWATFETGVPTVRVGCEDRERAFELWGRDDRVDWKGRCGIGTGEELAGNGWPETEADIERSAMGDGCLTLDPATVYCDAKAVTGRSKSQGVAAWP